MALPPGLYRPNIDVCEIQIVANSVFVRVLFIKIPCHHVRWALSNCYVMSLPYQMIRFFCPIDSQVINRASAPGLNVYRPVEKMTQILKDSYRLNINSGETAPTLAGGLRPCEVRRDHLPGPRQRDVKYRLNRAKNNNSNQYPKVFPEDFHP